MDYIKDLQAILKARKGVYNLNCPMVICLVLGLICSVFLPGLANFLGIAAGIVFYRRVLGIARLPSPRCGKSFGTKSNFVLGVGPEYCMHCGLGLYS